MTEIEFYFDYLSPYSYLAFRILTEKFMPSTWPGVKLILKPVSLPHVISKSGNLPPGDLPARRAFLQKDLQRTTEFYGIGPLRMPKRFPFDTRPALWQLIQADCNLELLRRTWNRIFLDGEIDFLAEISLTSEEIAAAKVKLQENTAEALAAGAFGVPFWKVRSEDGREETFFGSDRFHHMARFLGFEIDAKSKL